jgi:hypothetical protein
MSLIGANNYCADAVLADSTWLNAIADSAYMESVLNVKVPTLSDNDGCVGTSSLPYKAFDNDDTTFATCPPDSSIGYNFGKDVKIYYVFTKTLDALKANITYSEDNSNYLIAYQDIINTSTKGADVSSSAILTTTHSAQYWSIQFTSTEGNALGRTIQFYGREDV